MGISDTPTVLRISEELRIWTVDEDVESTMWMKKNNDDTWDIQGCWM